MFARRVHTRLISHPSPPVKDQRKLWKQPQSQSRSTAPESRQHGQRLKLFLPANTALHGSAVDEKIINASRAECQRRNRAKNIQRGSCFQNPVETEMTRLKLKEN
jgi:hypothetical protein